MRVTVDARLTGLPGIGRFIHGLLEGFKDAELAGAEITPIAGRRQGLDGWRGSGTDERCNHANETGRRALGVGEQFEMPLVLRRLRADVHHSTHLTVPYMSRTPVVLTVHDLFPLYTPSNTRSRSARLYYRAAFAGAARKASRIVAVSDHTKRDLVQMMGVPADRVDVINHGVDRRKWHRPPPERLEQALTELGVQRPYMLYVGTTKRQKNLSMLTEALESWFPPLVLAGPTRGEVAGAGLLERLPPTSVVLGRVLDDLLPSLYAGAEVLVLPSLFEGAGLTPLEAMACGTPVVCSTGGALPETVDDAALLVPPDDVEGWTDALERVLSDEKLRAGLVSRGSALTAERTWTAAAQRYLDVYRLTA